MALVGHRTGGLISGIKKIFLEGRDKRYLRKTEGLISGWAYIRNNIFVSKWMGLYPGGGLKPGGIKTGGL